MNPKSVVLPVTDPISPLRYTISESVSSGSFLRLSASGITMLQQVEIIDVKLPDTGESLDIVHRFSAEELGRNWSWYVKTLSLVVARVPRLLTPNTAIKVQLGYSPHDKGPAGPTRTESRYSGLTWSPSLGVVDYPEAIEFEEIAQPCEIRFVPGEPVYVESYLKPDGKALFRRFDAYGNPITGSHERAENFARSHNDSVSARPFEARHHHFDTSTRSMRRSAQCWAAQGTTGNAPKAPTQTARVEVKDSEPSAVRVNALPKAMDETPIFFGEFHWHTDFSSDGQRGLRDAMHSAQDDLCLDFAGPADHFSLTGKFTSGRTIAEQSTICRAVEKDGAFAAIPSIEIGRRYGHINLLADSFETLQGIVPRLEKELAPIWQNDPDKCDLAPLLDLCPGGKALAIPHTTNMDSFALEGVVRDDGRPAWGAMHWPIPADKSIIRLVEIIQNRGSCETELLDAAWRIHCGGFGGSVRTALMRGYRLGFVGGTDNHCGWPTRDGAEYGGLTAIQSDSLNMTSLFDALYHRRCYATSGARIVADTTLNGYPMGSELALQSDELRCFHIRIQATAPLSAVQLIHAGAILKDFDLDPMSLDFETRWEDDRPGKALVDSWYYVRVRQSDGHCAWLSPFWVN